MSDWQSQIIEEFRTNKGKVNGFLGGDGSSDDGDGYRINAS